MLPLSSNITYQHCWVGFSESFLNWDFGETHLARLDGHLIKGLEVGTYVTNADVTIALPKLKTHGFMQFTGATKILFGVIPGTIKLGYHAKFPELNCENPGSVGYWFELRRHSGNG